MVNSVAIHLNHKEHEAHQRPHKDDLGSDSPGLFRPGFANRYGEEMGWLKMKSLWFPCVPCAPCGSNLTSNDSHWGLLSFQM
jgi:hypothetical protein